MKARPDMARTEMQLCNDADVPLLFKLRSDRSSAVTAAPAGSGYIPPRAEQRCFLTWRRAPNVQNWQDAKAPKLILTTNFVEQEIDDSQTVMTRLLARLHADGPQDQLPLMKFIFEKQEEINSPSKIVSPAGDTTLSLVRMQNAREQVSQEINRIIQWFQRHPLEAMMLLLFFIALFFAIVN